MASFKRRLIIVHLIDPQQCGVGVQWIFGKWGIHYKDVCLLVLRTTWFSWTFYQYYVNRYYNIGCLLYDTNSISCKTSLGGPTWHQIKACSFGSLVKSGVRSAPCPPFRLSKKNEGKPPFLWWPTNIFFWSIHDNHTQHPNTVIEQVQTNLVLDARQISG